MQFRQKYGGLWLVLASVYRKYPGRIGYARPPEVIILSDIFNFSNNPDDKKPVAFNTGWRNYIIWRPFIAFTDKQIIHVEFMSKNTPCDFPFHYFLYFFHINL